MWIYVFILKFLLLEGLVQFSCSVVSHSATPWTAARQASLSITNSQSLLKLMPVELVMPSNHVILCCPLLLLPSILPSIKVFPVSQFFTSGDHSSKASILRHSAFFIVQLSHPYMTPGQTIALTRRTFVGKVMMSPLFKVLSRLIIAFLPRSKHLLISWLQSPLAVILEPKKIVCHYFHCFPIYLPWSDGTRYHDLSFLNVEF